VLSIIVRINYGAPEGFGWNMRKEERNKWGFLEAIAVRGKPFMPEIPCKLIPDKA
jgi:hypothetical protein